MFQSPYIRIILYIFIAISILNGWWFLAIPLLIIGTLLFSFIIEWVIAGVAYDALFGMVTGSGWRGYVGTLVAIACVGIFRMLKGVLRSY